VVVAREGLGEGLDFSVTVAGVEFGLGPGFTVVVVVRRWALGSDGVTVRPGVVTVSELAVVVAVVVVWESPSMWRRT
jgi:hypothetical protein